MESVTTLLALIAIIANLGPSTGLKCKYGGATLGSVENSTVVECPEGNNHYCVAGICSRKNLPSTAVILWTCNNEDKKDCAAGAKNVMQNMTQATDYSCECTFGEKGKDLANEKFTLTLSQLGLICKTGKYDGKGYGGSSHAMCMKGADFCYAARWKSFRHMGLCRNQKLHLNQKRVGGGLQLFIRRKGSRARE
uniref:EGF-like domain-containing protein n=1 Tax=Globodera pallida TaxID=36090 RepID=A0A183CKS3_GLOPA